MSRAGAPDKDVALDYQTAFDLAPIGLVLSRHRLIVDCNQQLLAMFGTVTRIRSSATTTSPPKCCAASAAKALAS